jgi:hypothetical protein
MDISRLVILKELVSPASYCPLRLDQIRPDGYIYAVDVDSMRSNQRTISYLSQLKYPEIYEWLIDKIDANDTVSATS